MKRLLKKWRMNRDIGRHLADHGGMYSYDGLRLSIPDSVALGVRHALAMGNYEAEEIGLAKRFIAPDLPVIELGACLGVVTAKLRSLIGPDVPLIAVEANAALIETARANTQRAIPAAPTELICAAVNYDGQTLGMQISDNAHISRLAPLSGHGVALPSITLAALVAKLPAGRDYSLVCDIEGAEYDVFEKDSAALARCRLAIVEIHPNVFAENGRSLEAFLALVKSAGFTSVAAEGDVQAFVRAG